MQNSESQPKDLYFSKGIFSGLIFWAAYNRTVDFQMWRLRKELVNEFAELVLTKERYELKPSNTTKNNQYKSLIDSSKAIRLRFSNASLGDGFGSCLLKNKKLDLWVRPWSLTPSHNLGLETFGLCNSESLKKSKSSRSQMFFEISSIKNFAIFTGKHLCWGLGLIKLHACRPATFLKRDSNTGVSCGYCEIFKNSFFKENLRWLLLTVLPQYSEVS